MNLVKIIIALVVVALVGFGVWKYIGDQNQAPQYQTAQVEKGTLITTVTASGQVSGASSMDITTQASGVVAKVYVKNGDNIIQGQKIADLTLDAQSQQKQVAAYANYLSAKNNLDSANNQFNTLQNTAFVTNQKLINDAVARTLATNDPTYIEESAAWLAAEGAYKNQQGVVAQAQTSLSNAALNLQQISATVLAPVSGVVANLTLAEGLPIANTSLTSSNNAGSGQSVGSINLPGAVQVVVNLSEVDVTKVQTGQKVTLSLDAFPGKTFSGRVLTINTKGTVSSNVTNYPTVIILDSAPANVYPNMSANASIITNVKDGVLLIPSGAIQTTNGQSSVRVMKNGQVQPVQVEIGDSNDTQTEITSGLSEGDQVVTGTATTPAQRTGGSTSPFGGGFRFGGGGLRGG